MLGDLSVIVVPDGTNITDPATGTVYVVNQFNTVKLGSKLYCTKDQCDAMKRAEDRE